MIIFVCLLDEGVDCWRRVEAVHEGDNRYRIVVNPDPAEERWEFATGEVVVCEPRRLSSDDVLVATRRAEEA
jgi:hypothetical protein